MGKWDLKSDDKQWQRFLFTFVVHDSVTDDQLLNGIIRIDTDYGIIDNMADFKQWVHFSCARPSLYWNKKVSTSKYLHSAARCQTHVSWRPADQHW